MAFSGRCVSGVALAAVLGLGWGFPVRADDPPKAAGKSAEKSGEKPDVTVTAQKPLNRIDRQVYDNTRDPDSKTGTALDALAKVPGVSVDPSGNVTLRGKEPQILINGRPAPELQGDNRAAALQAMSSGSITSIEVSNNPGAQYGTGSSSSVINIITTTALPPGGFLSAQLQSTGGGYVNISGHAPVGRANVNALLGIGDSRYESGNASAKRSLDGTGHVLRTTKSQGRSASRGRNVNGNLSADYRLGDKDTLAAGFVYSRFGTAGRSEGRTAIYDTGGTPTDIYASGGESDMRNETQTASLGWNHSGRLPGETLKVDLRASQGSRSIGFANRSQYSLASLAGNLAGVQSGNQNASRTGSSTFSVDYNRPFGDDQLTAGMQISHETSRSRSRFATSGAVTTVRDSEFDYDQTVRAAYATWQKPLGDHWTVLGGLRAEAFAFDGLAPLVSLNNHVAYTTWNPSLFATYVMSEKTKVRFSYSHRLQRPYPGDYNPQTVQTSETSQSVGQADLKPQKTDAFETGYEFASKATSFQMRGYYTLETGIVTSVSTVIADPLNLGNLVTRTARRNAGTRRTLGAEFNFSGKLTKALSLNTNANLASVALETPNFNGRRTVVGVTGRAALSYEVTKIDRLYLNANISPEMLDTQGYRTGFSSVGLQYIRKFPNNTQLTVAISDATRSNKTKSFTTTPLIDGFSVSSRQTPTFYISLSKSLGGVGGVSKSQGTATNSVIRY